MSFDAWFFVVVGALLFVSCIGYAIAVGKE